jgi:hypothetical protein
MASLHNQAIPRPLESLLSFVPRSATAITMHRPVAVQHLDFKQQMLLAEPSEMNQPPGLTMIQHHLSLLTPEARASIFSLHPAEKIY